MSCSAMFTMVASSTTISWQVRIRARTRPGGRAGAAARGVAAAGRPARECDAVRRTGWSLHRHERNLDRSSSIGEAEGSSGKNNTEVASGFASCFRRCRRKRCRRDRRAGRARAARACARTPPATARRCWPRPREVYAERGVEASLEEIARRAGVGIGTLYRHFPNRDALNEAVYRREVDSLCDGVDELLAEQAPVEALAQWMRRFAGYVARKRGMAMALKSALGPDNELFSHSHRRIRRRSRRWSTPPWRPARSAPTSTTRTCCAR